jgi:hypothetical protein
MASPAYKISRKSTDRFKSYSGTHTGPAVYSQLFDVCLFSLHKMGNIRGRADLRPSIKSVMSSVTFTTKITAESVAIRLI